jgi:hypothetical protein
MYDHAEGQRRQAKQDQPSRQERPIVESEALDWEDLFPGTQDAFKKLIELLKEATEDRREAQPKEEQENPRYEQLPTSILVSGDRGFGKTTVLLTAEYATGKGRAYLNEDSDSPDGLGNRLQELKSRVCWLEMLDLEPTLGKANLLATVLVRIRDALDRRYPALGRHGNGVPASILEEGVEKPWKSIDHLIRDATFMWEEASNTVDPRRERADQQIRAAETYARFQQDFKEAVQGVAKALGRDSDDGATVLVLPIDHVDRSVEHLYGIVKLMRMAVSPHLWFLLAAGRQDFQLFLERSFQHELLAGSSAGMDSEFIDQTREIARYQSAARLQRSLPDAYRIQIESATAKVAFAYPRVQLVNAKEGVLSEAIMNGADGKVRSHEEPFLGAVLNEVQLHAPPPSDGLFCFADLLVISRRLEGPVFKKYCAAQLDEKERDLQSELPDSFVLSRLQALVSNRNLSDGELRSKFQELGLYSGLPSDRDLRQKLQEFVSKLVPLDCDLPSKLQELASNRNLSDGELGSKLREYGSKPESPDSELSSRWKALDPQSARSYDLNWHFSFAAKTALDLSARALRDLWLYVEERHNKLRGGLDLEECAVRMLKIAIDDSTLPFWASELLHNSVIRKNAHREWILDLGGRAIRPSKLTSPPEILKWGDSSHRERVASSELQLRHLSDYNLELQHPSERQKCVPLPPSVAGWFMLLHDLLCLSDRVLCPELQASIPHEMMPDLVVTRHEFWFEDEVVSLDFAWSTPPWGLFLDHFIFIAQWRAFLEEIRERLREPLCESDKRTLPAELFDPSSSSFSSFFPRLIQAAWVENVCSVAGEKRGKWDWGKPDESSKNRGKRLRGVFGGPSLLEGLKGYEKHVRGEVSDLHKVVKDKGNVILKDRRGKALVWLERSLPLFALPEYAPSDDSALLWEPQQEETDFAELHSWWMRHPSMIATARQESVRAAAERSPRFQGTPLGTSKAQGEARRWVNSLVKAWFQRVDPDVRRRRNEGLRGVTLDSLDGSPVPATTSAAEASPDNPQ